MALLEATTRASRSEPISRRALLRGAGIGALTLLCGARVRAAIEPPRRALEFENLHTGETLSVVYWAGGRYAPDALERVNRHLRDHRTGEVHPIEPGLLDVLYDLRRRTGTHAPFQVISGYRSPETNAMLRARGGEVVHRSLHTVGKAVDVRLADVSSRKLRAVALGLARGGVGYYEQSDFVHIDVGPVRSW